MVVVLALNGTRASVSCEKAFTTLVQALGEVVRGAVEAIAKVLGSGPKSDG
jgi:hypothetical protein